MVFHSYHEQIGGSLIVMRMHYLSEILDELVIFLWKILTSHREKIVWGEKSASEIFPLRSKVSLGLSSSILSCFLTSRLENIQFLSIHVDDVDQLEVFLSDLPSWWQFSSVWIDIIQSEGGLGRGRWHQKKSSSGSHGAEVLVGICSICMAGRRETGACLCVDNTTRRLKHSALRDCSPPRRSHCVTLHLVCADAIWTHFR